MAIIKWTPFLEPFEEMDKFMDDYKTALIKGFTPAVDIYDSEDAVIVQTSLAGVNPEEVDISIENDVLTIKGETIKESEVDDKNYYRKEIKSGSFFRSVALPAHVISDKASADFKDGMLKITVPKAKSVKSKTIKVKIAKKK